MPEIKNPLELYKLLKKSNCRECMLPSCMAFFAAVIQGRKNLADCPYVDFQTIDILTKNSDRQRDVENEQEEELNNLKRKISQIDFSTAEQRPGAVQSHGKLGITCLGKAFWIDSAGEMTSECHNNLWVHVPVNYIVHSKGKDLLGEWVAFGELRGAGEWNRFF